MQPLLVVMGVTGSGKSTVGRLLASELGVRFVDADDLHPAANIRKMASGHPLNDDDRWPWLQRVGEELRTAATDGLVVACSALTFAYRQVILTVEPRTRFVYLHGSRELLQTRLSGRRDHFMPEELLDSQLATLEPLTGSEPGFAVSITGSPNEIITEIRAKLAAL